MPGLTVRTIQGGINTFWNIRLGFIGYDEMMVESGKSGMNHPSRLVVCDQSWVNRVKDKADHIRAFTNMKMIEEATGTIGSNEFVIVQRNNIMALSILSWDALAN